MGGYRDIKTHGLKVWPEEFQAIEDEWKCAEFRKNDRDFQDGDVLLLQEWDPELSKYTGRSKRVGVTNVVYGPKFGIPEGYCMMSLNFD